MVITAMQKWKMTEFFIKNAFHYYYTKICLRSRYLD